MNQNPDLLDQLRIDRNSDPRPAIRLRNLLWITAGTACVVAVGLVASKTITISRESDHSRIPSNDRVAVTSAKPASAPPSSSSLLDASGYVVALREATVSAKSIYKVTEVLVQEGQPVKAGDIIARLDDTNVRAASAQSKVQVKKLEAELDATRVAADDARPIFLRNQQQLRDRLISQDTFDTAKASYDAVRTAVAVSEQNLALAKANVDVNLQYEEDTVIRAPFDGVVTVKTAQPGEIVSPQFSGGGGIAKIVDMDSLEVNVDVSENFIQRVHPRQPAIVTLNAYPNWRIPAKVIALIPTADRAKATVKVRIGFDTKDSRIVPEMGAHVSFLDGVQESPVASLSSGGEYQRGF